MVGIKIRSQTQRGNKIIKIIFDADDGRFDSVMNKLFIEKVERKTPYYIISLEFKRRISVMVLSKVKLANIVKKKLTELGAIDEIDYVVTFI